jgi:hypothetical protein
MLGRLRRQALPLILRSVALAALTALAALVTAPASTAVAPSADPLAAEIERWSAYLKTNTATDEMWVDVKQATEPAMTRAGDALRAGRRLLALQRLAAARVDLSAWLYLAGRPAGERKEDAGFEAEWARMGKTLKADMGTPSPRALEGVRPAALRAIGEAALPQIKVYYDASLEYGRNTMPDAGLFYLGSAQAQRELIAFCRSLAASPSGVTPTGRTARRAPPLRDIGADIDTLEDDLLALYRPPVSIDRHVEFIVAGSALKEARELNAAGLRYGALMRYLDAARRVAPLRPAPAAPPASSSTAAPAPAADALAKQLADLDARLSSGDLDHSLGRLYLEMAQADLDAPPPARAPAAAPAPGAVAAAIAGDVLPRYFAALAKASPQPPRPAARVTVTMVRWPYT